MVDRVEVDPDGLAIAAGIAQELGDSILGVGSRLRERLGALEDEQNRQPWGNDSYGEKFVNGNNNDGYGTSKPNLLDGVDGIGGTFVAIATGQTDAVNELRRMDGQV
ncbi:hypothetical protein ACH474_32660 [Nocardia rhamnosiphila]|uniref:hypothetical protein n=1 Tax=Nocardia rhamnosiphila TaxID=426716 RepID=UPI0004C35609|nr:hypothetical protein [Nocardia rhamnosiphila]